MSRQFASILLIVALVVAACGAPPEFDGWCYTFVFNGLDRTPESLIVTEGTVTEVGIDSIEIAENQWSIIFEFEVLPFVQIDDLRFQIFNWTDPLVTVGTAATGTVFGQSANLEGDLDLDDNQIWIPGNVLDDFVSGRTVEVTIQADGPISLYQLQVGGDDDVSPFGVDDCAPATATPPPTPSETPTITNTPAATDTAEPTLTPTPYTLTPTPDYSYRVTITLPHLAETPWTAGGVDFNGGNLFNAPFRYELWDYLPWEYGTPIKLMGYSGAYGRHSLQSSSGKTAALLLETSTGVDIAFATAGWNVCASPSYIVNTGAGYRAVAAGSLNSEADLDYLLPEFTFYIGHSLHALVGSCTGGRWGTTVQNIYWSDFQLEFAGPPVGDPTNTPTPTPTITNTPTPTPTRTPIAGTFVYTPSPGTPAPTPWPWTTATVTPWATNTPIPVAPSNTPGPSPTPLPTSTYIPTSTLLPQPTFPMTWTANPTYVIGDGSPIPQITAIFTGQPLPDITIQATNLGTIPTVSHRSEVYWFLATADAQVAQLPSSIGAYIPDLSGGGAELFGYIKWMISGVSIQEIFGPTFAPHGFHAVVAFTVVIVGSLIMLGLRIVKLMLKIALWLINQVLKLIPGLG